MQAKSRLMDRLGFFGWFYLELGNSFVEVLLQYSEEWLIVRSVPFDVVFKVQLDSALLEICFVRHEVTTSTSLNITTIIERWPTLWPESLTRIANVRH